MKADRDEFRRRINLVTGLKFSDRGAAELEESLGACRDYADPGAAGRQAPSFMAPDWSEPKPFKVLCALVEIVEDVWREHGGKGHGARRDADGKQGPLVRLLLELFKFAGARTPSARTLRDAILRVRRREPHSSDE